MQICVLGAVAISDAGGRAVSRPERKGREILTTLVLRAPAAVTLDELADLLWDLPPESAVKTIRSHVSRVRAALDGAGVVGGIQAAGSNGYRIVVPPGTTDVDCVAACRRRARELQAAGASDAAADALAEARALWAGEPELPETVAGSALARGWRRERRQVTLEHLRCVVDGSDPSQALGELERLVAADPTDEPMCVLHVLALHRSGHNIEAIRAVAAARAALADIGLDMGAELSRVEAEVFAGPARARESTIRPSAPAADVTDGGDGPIAVQYAGVDGRHVAFTVQSSGARDLLVLNPAMITIDGLLDEPHAREAAGRLARHARVVMLDRRGIGLTDPLDLRRHALDEWVDDILFVLDAVGTDRVDLLANLDTGLVAIELAARHPERVRSLALAHCYASLHRREGYPFGADAAAAQQMIRDFVTPGAGPDEIAVEHHMAPSLADDADFVRWWNRIGQRAASPGAAMTIHTIAMETDVRDRLGSIRAPTLVLHRRGCLNVEIGHARYLAEHIPDAELRILPGTDSLWFTDTADLLDATIEFLRRDSSA